MGVKHRVVPHKTSSWEENLGEKKRRTKEKAMITGLGDREMANKYHSVRWHRACQGCGFCGVSCVLTWGISGYL